MTVSQRSLMHLVIGQMLDGKIAGRALITTLSDMDLNHLSAEEMAGAVDAVMERSIRFPEIPDAVDCCGTGGDGLKQRNVSTAVAIVAAACGVTVVKHGNRAVSSSSGSSDVLEALGVKAELPLAALQHMIKEIGIAFLHAPSFHPGLAQLAPARKAIGKRTIFNLLGPLCNPARPQRQLIGVFSPRVGTLLAQTALILRKQRVITVHGDDGADEISISGPTQCVEAAEGTLHNYKIRPQDGGLPIHPLHALAGGSAAENAEALRAVLAGAPGAYADAVALNCAVLLMAADKVRTLDEGVVRAQSVIARGDAKRKLTQLIEMSHA